MAAKSTTVIDLDHDRLTVATIVRKGKSCVLRSWASVSRPEGLDPSDAGAMGRWISECMGKAAKRGRVLISLPRREAVLKRVVCPPGVREDEVPGVVQLELHRQLAVGLEEASIDYIPLDAAKKREKGEKAEAGDGPAVLAAAVTGPRMAFFKEMAKAAGIKPAAISLRTLGMLELAGREPEALDGSVLAIAVLPSSTEFAWISGGRLVTARPGEVRTPETDDAESRERFAARLAVEARRTWVAARSASEPGVSEAVLVLGADGIASRVAERCGDSIGVAARAVGLPGWIKIDPKNGPADDELARLLPLIGLAVAPQPRLLNFLDPRKGPDRSAKYRMGALAAGFGLIVLGGGGWVFANQELSRLNARLSVVSDNNRQFTEQYIEQLLLQARVEHLEARAGLAPDWMAHLDWISRRMLSTEELLLSQLQGSATSELSYTPRRGGGPLDGQWNTGREVRVSISAIPRGEAGAAVLERQRSMLIAGGGYRVSTQGPDTGSAFTLNLRSGLVAPIPDKDTEDEQ